jgi:hypothetical protein
MRLAEQDQVIKASRRIEPMRRSTWPFCHSERGAVPIILAIFAVMAGAPHARQMFDLVFFAVLVNTIFPAP